MTQQRHLTPPSPHDPPDHPHYNILLVSDFFFPHQGGVESHIYNLAQCLIRRGHKIIIVSKAYHVESDGTDCVKEEEEEEEEEDPSDDGEEVLQSRKTGKTGKKSATQFLNRHGVRYMMHGLKCYYVPFFTLGTRFGLTTLLSSSGFLSWYRDIIIREEIDVVHGHQGSSMMALECMNLAVNMDIPCLLTEHSLFGFGSPAIMWLNKAQKSILYEAEALICCSYISKENLSLRVFCPPEKIHVIPHAVDTAVFRPFPERPRCISDEGKIVIVTVTRLTVRKGAALLLKVIPMLLAEFPDRLKFLIAGGGEMEAEFRDLVEKRGYEKTEVELLGRVDNSLVPAILNRGDIFLNTSLTEVFCIAILEAAACGLYVVATEVGGVPEILPDDMISLCPADTDGLLQGIRRGLEEYNTVDRFENHRRVDEMYNWDLVAERTEKVYDTCIATHTKREFPQRVNDFLPLGPVVGKLASFAQVLIWLLLLIWAWVRPDHEVDRAIDLAEAYRVRERRMTPQEELVPDIEAEEEGEQ